MIKLLFGIILTIFLINTLAIAQSDTIKDKKVPKKDTIVPEPAYIRPVYRVLDSAALAKRQAYRDSLQEVRDSLSMVWIKKPDPDRPNKFIDSLISLYKVENLNFVSWASKFQKNVNRYNEGIARPRGETWVITIILLLVLFFALIRFFFYKELNSIIHSFYSNQMLNQINKEDNLFSSWPFVFLYLLFGLVIGMYLYLSGKYFQLSYPVNGFELFLLLSTVVIGLFTIKIIVLRLLGFLFDIKRLVREYIAILYLSYFNAALIFLPLVIAFSLTPYRFVGIYSYIGIIMLAVIFILQFLRAGANILSNYKFPKVYLIIYLCALEFCPLIILVKALRF